MKIGTQTASLINNIYARSTNGQPNPEVGMGVTMLGWTDRYPGRITEVFMIGKLTAIAVEEMNAIRTDNGGFTEAQTYEYLPYTDGGNISYYSQDATGYWTRVYRNPETNRWIKGTGGLIIGQMEKYYDFTF